VNFFSQTAFPLWVKSRTRAKDIADSLFVVVLSLALLMIPFVYAFSQRACLFRNWSKMVFIPILTAKFIPDFHSELEHQ